MTPQSESFYVRWRSPVVAAGFLRDENFPTERLLQAVWRHQRLQRDALKTTDGKTVRVLHPGFASVEGGPDFRGAVLQIGDDAPRSGDVEIDLRVSGWRAHGHDRNPNFQNVLLHAIWEDEVQSPKSRIPGAPVILPLQNVLDAPLAELGRSLEDESPRALPENFRGQCCLALRGLDEAKLTELLREAAGVRLQNKAEQIRARAKNAGWEQALWEQLFRALGYKHNAWPMQNLAEQFSASPRLRGENVFEIQARLLGVSGLLPAELTRAQKSSGSYLRRVWDFWWRERDEFAGLILPRAAWKFHGLRPANHPQRRLALAAHWLADKNFVSKIEGWSAAEIPEERLLESLHEILQAGRDEFWSWHWTFQSPRLKKPQPLLGGARLTDLAVNVILPWLWVRGACARPPGGGGKILREAGRRYFSWPAAEDNSVLKLARQRLLGTADAKILKTAAAQQGLMQVVRDFCGRSNAVCENCPFPKLVHEWAAGKN